MAADAEPPTRRASDGSPELELQAYMRKRAGKSARVLRFFRVAGDWRFFGRRNQRFAMSL